MAKLCNPPKFSEVIALLSLIKLPWENRESSIGDWGKKHRVNVVKANRSKSDIEIFNTFVASLLQVAGMKGENKFGQRVELMDKYFRNFSDITEESARRVLKLNGYRWLNRGINVILKAREEKLRNASLTWEWYFQKAESRFEGGFDDDLFLKINGVGRKGRDFALAQFSLHYCAIDKHIADVLTRTGLIIRGYGDLDLGTNPSDEGNYKFMQRLIIQFAKETGWPSGLSEEWSPGEIDSSLWFFGQGICKGRPECSNCPVTELCLTYQNKVN